MKFQDSIGTVVFRAVGALLLAGCCLGVRAAEPAAETQPAMIDDAQTQGDRALASGDRVSALLIYTSALSSAPVDSDLAHNLQDKAIQAATGLDKKPPVPDEAKDIMAHGKAYIAQAQSPHDYVRAVTEMKKALSIAPWWSTGYFNTALAEEAAGQFADAATYLKIYLRLNPDADDKEKVRNKIAALDVRAESSIQWITIAGGSFMMGHEKWGEMYLPHNVAVRTFQMAKALTTFDQYKECVAAGGCSPAHVSDGTCTILNGSLVEKGNLPIAFQGGDQPAVCVDWTQAQEFSRWAGGRLPTEAEWEYAARSEGKVQKYPWGNDEATCSLTVMKGCIGATASVCSKPAGNTVQGLCDMGGNAFEWVEDWFHNTYVGAPNDGSAWEDAGSSRGYRGGAWDIGAAGALAVGRGGHCEPGCHDYHLGFRVAR